MTDKPPILVARDGGALLRVAVVPNARRTEVDGLHDGALKLRLAAPPVEGRANEMLVEWIAAALGLPRRSVRIARGAAARRKSIEIDAPVDAVQRWLDSVVA
jgi:uncharacterized protein (TIGR00251 family)